MALPATVGQPQLGVPTAKGTGDHSQSSARRLPSHMDNNSLNIQAPLEQGMDNSKSMGEIPRTKSGLAELLTRSESWDELFVPVFLCPEEHVKGHHILVVRALEPTPPLPPGLNVSVENIFLEVKLASRVLIALKAPINVRTRSHGAIGSVR